MDNNAQFQRVREATAEEVTSSLEAHETVASSLITLQGTYLRWAQSLLLNWMEVLTPPWWQLPHKQQAPFQRLLATPMQPYLDWMLAPLTFSRKLVETSMTLMQRERERGSSARVPVGEALREPTGSLTGSEQPQS